MKSFQHLLVFLFHVAIVLAKKAKGQEIKHERPNHKGKAFILGFLEMDNHRGTSAIYITSTTMAEINITVPFLNKTFTRYSTPGVSTRVHLRTTVRMRGMRQENKGIFVTANTTVSIYATNARSNSRDVYVIFPISTLGNEYVVATYTPIYKSLVGIIALNDNTLIQIKLRLEGNLTYDGKIYSNGDVIRIFLNRLQTFQLQYTGDLTGTFVISTGPVVVLGGNICTKVPKSKYDCSHLATQLIPVSKWGTRFITSPIAGRKRGDYFKIVSGYDDTEVCIHGMKNFTLNAGEWNEFSLTNKESRYITCTKPVMLMQYNKGSSGYIRSEPFALTVLPMDQYTTEYHLPIGVELTTPPFANYITIIVETSAMRSILFNSSKYCWSNMTMRPMMDFNYTVFACELQRFNVTTVFPIKSTSNGVRFASYMVGHTDKDGYGYLGGMEMSDINCQRLYDAGPGLIIGDSKDTICDEWIDENKSETTSCDIKVAFTQPVVDNSVYLNGSEYKFTVNYVNQDGSQVSPTRCEAFMTSTWSFKAPNGVEVTAARQIKKWKKQKAIIVLPKRFELNVSVEEIRVKSSLCPGDRLYFNDSTSVKENGTKVIKRLWVVQEDCGRDTTATQTVIVQPNGDVNPGGFAENTTLAIILGTSLGIPIFLLAIAISIAIAWRRHMKSRKINITVRINVKEAPQRESYTNHATTIEDCFYSKINEDMNHNSAAIEKGKAIRCGER